MMFSSVTFTAVQSGDEQWVAHEGREGALQTWIQVVSAITSQQEGRTDYGIVG